MLEGARSNLRLILLRLLKIIDIFSCMKRTQLLKNLMRNLEHGFESASSNQISLMIERGLRMGKDDQRLISNFCDMCAGAMDLEGDYKCFLSDDRKRAQIVTTAICDFSSRNIRIYCHERALADILRSIAHEMYHLRQHELDLVPRKMKKHHLSPIEWHANVAAGSLLSYFAQKVGKDKIYR